MEKSWQKPFSIENCLFRKRNGDFHSTCRGSSGAPSAFLSAHPLLSLLNLAVIKILQVEKNLVSQMGTMSSKTLLAAGHQPGFMECRSGFHSRKQEKKYLWISELELPQWCCLLKALKWDVFDSFIIASFKKNACWGNLIYCWRSFLLVWFSQKVDSLALVWIQTGKHFSKYFFLNFKLS